MQTVKGTIQRGECYYSNVKIPTALRSAYGGKTHYRQSLKTSDPRTAETRVGIIRATIAVEVEAARRQADLDRLTAALAPEEQKIFREAGGLSGLIKRFEGGRSHSASWRRQNRAPCLRTTPTSGATMRSPWTWQGTGHHRK